MLKEFPINLIQVSSKPEPDLLHHLITVNIVKTIPHRTHIHICCSSFVLSLAQPLHIHKLFHILPFSISY